MGNLAQTTLGSELNAFWHSAQAKFPAKIALTLNSLAFCVVLIPHAIYTLCLSTGKRRTGHVLHKRVSRPNYAANVVILVVMILVKVAEVPQEIF